VADQNLILASTLGLKHYRIFQHSVN